MTTDEKAIRILRVKTELKECELRNQWREVLRRLEGAEVSS